MSCGDDSKVILWDLSDLKNITQKRMRHIGLRIITSTDFFSDSISYVSTGITGKIIILSPVSSYKITLGLPINKAVFVPNEKHFMELVVATQGLGVIRIKAVNMKFSNRRMIK
jgi:WD40 repeat protein